ncbi:MAG: hypothetical protein SynsKO_28580 [Synoicihabitans sp.]
MQIDHTELFVPDRNAAVVWYGEWLQFHVMPEHADWAQEGPLMLTHDGGATMLALFSGEPAGEQTPRGWRRVAYRVNGEAFRDFFERFKASGQSIEGPIDHGKSWSVYFSDPWGNALEVTTYDYDAVKAVVVD